MIARALMSVSNKEGLLPFAQGLAALGIEILSTGGTARRLRDDGMKVTEVSDHTGFPELMDGRVKTLHPKIHGGLLGRRGVDDAVMAAHGIAPIDLLVVNLYPFETTVARPDCTLADAIEHIDIGGPALLRAAAKNHAAVTVLVDPADYSQVLHELRATGQVDDTTRFRLAVKAFAHTAQYDGAIANYLGALEADGTRTRFPEWLSVQFHKAETLRYGENPHQQAAFYQETTPPPASIANARQVQGKALSYNNLADADAAWECVKSLGAPACVIVKHANPCGVAVAADLGTAYERAYRCDPESAFGGIIAVNHELDAALAEEILRRQFVEVILAPRIKPRARAALAQKPNVRVLECGAVPTTDPMLGLDFKRIGGGLLVQQADHAVVTAADLKTVTQRAPSAPELNDLLFAWKVVKFVKSNAIVYARDGATLGIGAGQMSRVYSARIAGLKAAAMQLQVTGAVMASDAFFPFRDGIDRAAEAGIAAVIQPGGSMRDAEVIAAADEHGMAMVFTGIRHFRH